MIVQALVDYYEALARKGKIARPGWGLEKAAFALDISLDGQLLGVMPLVTPAKRNNKDVELPWRQMLVPEHVVKAAGIKANFVCDTSSYFLGLDDKGKPQRSKECFGVCKALHLKVLKEVDSDAARAVVAFLEQWDAESAREHPMLEPYLSEIMTPNLVFQIDGGKYAHEDDAVIAAWQSYYDGNPGLTISRCAITGQPAPIARLHGKVKGVDGAQPAGANLISCNVPAFESYNRKEAPVSELAAFKHITALNALLADREHKRKIGDTSVVYWAEGAEEAPRKVFSFALDPTPDTEALLIAVMDKLARGAPIDGIDLSKRFYVLGLAPNAARVSVRFFLQNSFGAMMENLKAHYERLEIAKPPNAPNHLSPSMLLKETVNPNARDKSASPLLSGEVMRAILSGSRYPQALYQAVLGRIRAEQDNPDRRTYKISYGRAAIIKAYLTQQLNPTEREVLSVSLNETTTNRAYVLGRLFAVLEHAQQDANPGINTTIKDRYFTSACATPESVFPTLLKLANHHINKAKYGYARDNQIAALMDKLDVESAPFPAHQSLNDQGLFILGYYQQTQARYTKKEDAANGGDSKSV